VGKYIPVTKVMRFVGKTMVVSFNGKCTGKDALSRWMEQQWKHVLGYLPKAQSLYKGWKSFLLH
jgi:hypothetical protein